MMTQTNLDRLKAYADAHAQLLTDNCSINPELYQTYGVKRGLRDQKGRGVLAGLTNISEIVSNKQVNGETVPCEGPPFLPRVRHHGPGGRRGQGAPLRL